MENNNSFKKNMKKALVLVPIGIVAYAAGCTFQGSSTEDVDNVQYEVNVDATNEPAIVPDTTGYVDNITFVDAITDMKAIELEFEKYGLINPSNEAEAKEIRKGIAALYVRVNSDMPADVLNELYKNNFIAKDAKQVISDSLTATSLLLTYYENAYANNAKDTFDASMFCRNGLDKEMVSKVYAMAKENYDTENMEIVKNNIDTLVLYYKNLDSKVLPYYGTRHSADALTHLGGHIAGMGAARNGYSEKAIQEMEEFITFGNFSLDAAEIDKMAGEFSKTCPWFTLDDKEKTMAFN